MRQAFLLPLTALLLMAACDDPSGPFGGTTPARVDVVSGDLQPNVVVGTEGSVPLVVRVVNVEGRPLSGKTVTFQVVSGGGSVVAGTVQTDDNGEARDRWKLGTVAGDTQRVEARVETKTGQAQLVAVFRAVGKPDAPSTLALAHSGTLGGAVSSVLDDSIGVVVRDRHGNLVPGASVSWAAVTGGGTFAPAISVSNAAGVAWTRWMLGSTPGEQRARATLQGTASSAEVAANAGTELRIVAGDNILSLDGTLWEQPAVALFGPNGPIGDARVEWTVTSGGGSVSSAASRTSAGNPAVTTWTLGATAGTQQLTARVGNLRVTLTAQRPAARSLQLAGTPGGRVVDAEGNRALVLDSAGGNYTLRERTLSGGGGTVIATGGADLTGRLFNGGVLYSQGSGSASTVHEFRSGATVQLGSGRGILREGEWAAWRTDTRGFRRNLRTAVNDSASDNRLIGLHDLSATGQVVYSVTFAGTRYVVWGVTGAMGIASGNARVRVSGDTAFFAQDPSNLSRYTFFYRQMVTAEVASFFNGRDGQRPQFSAMGGRIALREEGDYGVELARVSVAREVLRIGRRPYNSAVVYTDTDQALTSSGSAAFLIREGGTTWLVVASGDAGATSATQVPGDSRLLERGGSILLVTTSSVYVVE